LVHARHDADAGCWCRSARSTGQVRPPSYRGISTLLVPAIVQTLQFVRALRRESDGAARRG
jgi:hypothetical protein